MRGSHRPSDNDLRSREFGDRNRNIGREHTEDQDRRYTPPPARGRGRGAGHRGQTWSQGRNRAQFPGKFERDTRRENPSKPISSTAGVRLEGEQTSADRPNRLLDTEEARGVKRRRTRSPSPAAPFVHPDRARFTGRSRSPDQPRSKLSNDSRPVPNQIRRPSPSRYSQNTQRRSRSERFDQRERGRPGSNSPVGGSARGDQLRAQSPVPRRPQRSQPNKHPRRHRSRSIETVRSNYTYKSAAAPRSRRGSPPRFSREATPRQDYSNVEKDADAMDRRQYPAQGMQHRSIMP